MRSWIPAAIGIALLTAAPSFGFVFGEPLPLLPPIPGAAPEPPPLVGSEPPIGDPQDPPGGSEPGDPPNAQIAGAPEPATVVMGILGMGFAGGIAALRRRIAARGVGGRRHAA